jgi:hypothetical protein
MKSTGTLADPPAASRYITDEYMKRVDADPQLKAYANRAN